MSTQQFMPAMWLGSYSLAYGPNNISFDQEGYVAEHPIVSAQEATEPIGYSAQKVAFNGFLLAMTGSVLQSVTDLQNFTLNYAQRFNRPVAVGFFTADPSGTATSTAWYSSVGYIQSSHFEYEGGRPTNKFPFRFTLIEAKPVTLITCSDAGAHTAYTFSMTGQGSGFLAGFQVSGTSYGTSSTAQSISSIQNNVPTTIGTGPILGSAANQLFASNPTATSSTIYWPIQDSSSNESIQLTSPTGTYTVTWNRAWTGTPTIKAVYIKV